MKKFWHVFWGILIVAGVSVVLIITAGLSDWGKCGYAVKLCVSGQNAVQMTGIAGLEMIEEGEYGAEDVRMQIVYQLAKRSVVKVVMKDAAGSGIIWKIDDGIVVASNRHLLMKDVAAEIVFGNGETVHADVIGYSQQYDIGFVRIPKEAVTTNILRDIYEAVPALYETESQDAKTGFAQHYAGKRILQIGAVLDKNTANFSAGSINGLVFVPLFNTNVLETACFSKAGMSGGGVFDESGHFLGMISGGEVPEDAGKREAEITYSIPASLIAAEYEAGINGY